MEHLSTRKRVDTPKDLIHRHRPVGFLLGLGAGRAGLAVVWDMSFASLACGWTLEISVLSPVISCSQGIRGAQQRAPTTHPPPRSGNNAHPCSLPSPDPCPRCLQATANCITTLKPYRKGGISQGRSRVPGIFSLLDVSRDWP